MALRVIYSIILLFSVLFLPFWVSIILAFVGIVRFPLYLEATILFLISDLLYGAKEIHLHNIYFVSLIGTLVLLILIETFKKKLKFYKK